jgi:hypothetical protein
MLSSGLVAHWRLEDLKNPDFQAYLAFVKYLSDQTKTSTGKLAEPLMQAGYGGQPLSSIYVYENLAVKLAFIRKVNGRSKIIGPRVVVSVPSGITAVENPKKRPAMSPVPIVPAMRAACRFAADRALAALSWC